MLIHAFIMQTSLTVGDKGTILPVAKPKTKDTTDISTVDHVKMNH